MKPHKGGFLVGLVVGVLIGLVLSLSVALYVTKAPVPFVNKVPQRSAAQEAAEAERNRNWDPNAPLSSRSAATVPLLQASAPAATQGTPASARDPAAILAGKEPALPPAGAVPAGAATAPAKPPVESFSYFVQAGAYARTEEAEQQRARLAMIGVAARITEREQSGRTVYRVRVGPFEQKEEAESTRDRLASSGVESALVRVQK
jgi:cell division protein FtsN